jgi:hypothetical protein
LFHQLSSDAAAATTTLLSKLRVFSISTFSLSFLNHIDDQQSFCFFLITIYVRPWVRRRKKENMSRWNCMNNRVPLACETTTNGKFSSQVECERSCGGEKKVIEEKKSSNNKLKKLHCKILDRILTTICTTDQLRPEGYVSFAKYRDVFLSHLLKHEAKEKNICSGGNLRLEIEENKIVTHNVSQMQINGWLKCVAAKRPFYINLHLEFGPEGGHANSILFSPLSRTYELFEPHGIADWTDAVGLALQSIFSQVTDESGHAPFSSWLYVEPMSYCPRISWQAVSGDAMCANWALLYTTLRFLCPDSLRGEIIDKLLSQGKQYLTALMQAWSCFMWQYAFVGMVLESDKPRDERCTHESIQRKCKSR